MAGLKIEELRKPADGGMYYSDVELCLDKDGNIVEAGSLASVKMLVGAGSCIPERVARQYGLIELDAESPPPFPVADLATADEAADEPAAASVKGAKGKQDKRRRGTSDK